MINLSYEEIIGIIKKAYESGERVDLSGTKLRGANLRHVDLRNINLSGANLRYADLRYADLRDDNLSTANLRYADLGYADFRGADLSGVDLSCVDLRIANLSTANLRDADLSYADLRDANLSGADLRSANLSGADLRSANLCGADVRGTKFPALTMVLLAQWKDLSDELTLECMRWDANAFPDHRKFDEWKITSNCPYLDANVERIINFYEKEKLWKSGKPELTLYELMEAILKEKCNYAPVA